MKRVSPGGFLLVLAFAFLHAQPGHATIVTVPNSNFETPTNAGTLTGNFGTTTDQLGAGPWRALSTGTIGLVGPTLTIAPGAVGGNDGVATISGLGTNNGFPPLTNSGEFFQLLSGVFFQPNTLYRLSMDVRTGSALTLAALSNAGIGIGAGTLLLPGLFKSTTAPPGDVTLVTAGLTGRLTFEFTTGLSSGPGEVRIRLYGGDFEGITTINPIPDVTFDNVLFEVIPEPSAMALLAVGCLGLARRRR